MQENNELTDKVFFSFIGSLGSQIFTPKYFKLLELKKSDRLEL